MARLIEVIETEDRRGDGTEGNPFRRIIQYWSKDGKLLIEMPDKWEKAKQTNLAHRETVVDNIMRIKKAFPEIWDKFKDDGGI